MARFAAVTALALSLLAAALATAEALDSSDPRGPPTAAGVFGPHDPGLYPGLRAVGELALPGSAPSDAGLGVYPSLSAPERLTFPRPPAIDAARRYAATRAGAIAFAVVDARGGVTGWNAGRVFPSASLVKAMMLVAYLDKLDRERRLMAPVERFRLDAMIRVSDNDSATWVFNRLGPEPLRELARRAGMRAFRVDSDWGNAQMTAGDQARFFLALDRLLAPRQREYGRYLLSSVAPFHSWGIPSVARPRWLVLFKGGWRPDGGGDIVHQAALLEHGARRLAIAVLTADNPSERYGHETVRGIALRLLRLGAAGAFLAAEDGRLAPLRSLSGHRLRARPPPPLRPTPSLAL